MHVHTFFVRYMQAIFQCELIYLLATPWRAEAQLRPSDFVLADLSDSLPGSIYLNLKHKTERLGSCRKIKLSYFENKITAYARQEGGG